MSSKVPDKPPLNTVRPAPPPAPPLPHETAEAYRRRTMPVFLHGDQKPIKAARFIVTGELMHELLLLPNGSEVRGMTWSHEHQAYEISVQGDALPDSCTVMPGCVIPKVQPHYRITDGFASFDGWGERP